jgi:hypothetical protein
MAEREPVPDETRDNGSQTRTPDGSRSHPQDRKRAEVPPGGGGEDRR